MTTNMFIALIVIFALCGVAYIIYAIKNSATVKLRGPFLVLCEVIQGECSFFRLNVEGHYKHRKVKAKQIPIGNYNSAIELAVKPEVSFKQRTFYLKSVPKPSKDTAMTYGWVRKNYGIKGITFSPVMPIQISSKERIVTQLDYLSNICRDIETGKIQID